MSLRLTQLPPGQLARVVEVRSSDPARLNRLGAYGLMPGSVLRLEQRRPTLIFRLGETEVAIDEAVGGQIMVEPI
jgi:DtxR family Mn-dependent transcriptional regulator